MPSDELPTRSDVVPELVDVVDVRGVMVLRLLPNVEPELPPVVGRMVVAGREVVDDGRDVDVDGRDVVPVAGLVPKEPLV